MGEGGNLSLPRFGGLFNSSCFDTTIEAPRLSSMSRKEKGRGFQHGKNAFRDPNNVFFVTTTYAKKTVSGF